jgi:hypothetical protein
MTWLGRYAGMIAAALLAMAGWSAWMTHRGVQKERSRVERIGKKIDAQAEAARKKVAAKAPSEIQRDLARYCRDCP